MAQADDPPTTPSNLEILNLWLDLTIKPDMKIGERNISTTIIGKNETLMNLMFMTKDLTYHTANTYFHTSNGVVYTIDNNRYKLAELIFIFITTLSVQIPTMKSKKI